MGTRSSRKTLVRNGSLSSVSWAKYKIKYKCGRDVAFLYESTDFGYVPGIPGVLGR